MTESQPSFLPGTGFRGRTFFVNADTGNDSNTGLSQDKAWKTLGRVNQAVFGPSDQLLFAGGQVFKGTLTFPGQSSGSSSGAFKVSSFGKGRARIEAGHGDGIVLDGCERVFITDIDVKGSGRKRGNNGVGIRLRATRRVQLEAMDVSGFRIAGIETGGDEDTRITHVQAHENGGAGILANGGEDDLPRSKRLYIGDCKVYNNAGDPKNLTNHSGNGIVVGGVDIALIEYCEAYNNGWDMPRDGNGPVGIWAWNSDRVVIQYCISHDNKSPGTDGGGFDFDGGVTNSYLQYNLSYNNQGAGFLLCQFERASRWRDNVVRFNVSYNDGSKNMQSGIAVYDGGGKFSRCEIYNNTIVNDRYAVNSWHPVKGMTYRNNIFLSQDAILIGDFRNATFANNFYGQAKSLMVDREGEELFALDEWSESPGHRRPLSGDAMVSLPRETDPLPTDPRSLSEMTFFRPLIDSPCLGGGIPVPNDGGKDMLGIAFPPAKPPIGAVSKSQP